MVEPVKWLYYDITQARYVDDDDPANYLSTYPESVLVEVHVYKDNPLPSGNGVGLIPEEWPLLTRHNSNLYDISINSDNLFLSTSGSTVVSGFLPLAGGTLYDFLTLHDHPQDDYHASTKQYVDDTISGSSISGAISDAISSLLQVDITIGTSLGGATNNKLPLAAVTAVINGEDFTLGSNEFTIKYPGMYQISWNVVGQMSGTAATRRRNIVADLNLNNGTSFPVGSLGGTYTRDKGSSPLVNVGGDYIIETIGDNETVAIRTRDFSDETMNGLIFETIGGYFRIRLVRKVV